MAIDSFKLTKLVCLSSLGCVTAVSLYYHNNKDSNNIEHLQQQQFRNQRIDSLKTENDNLRAQLGSASTSVILHCPSKKSEKKNIHWSKRSFTLHCGDPTVPTRNIFASNGEID